jgi:DNA-binding NarL/FixJ family response regulator
MTISVLLADDQALVRAGFRMIIDAEDGLEVVGEAADGLEAVEAAVRLRPNVVLMDIRMPELDGIEATRRVLAATRSADPPVRVLVLTTFDLNEYVYDALRAGASGFLLKDTPPGRLVDGVHLIAAGEALLEPAITRRLVEEFAQREPVAPPAPAPGIDDLTPRELEVFGLIARGRSNREIAAALFLSPKTVEHHLGSVFRKRGFRSRTELAAALATGAPS